MKNFFPPYVGTETGSPAEKTVQYITVLVVILLSGGQRKRNKESVY